MSSTPGTEPEALSFDERIDEVCTPFEAACKAAVNGGPWPSIENSLAAFVGSERQALLRELVLLDVRYRRRCGENLDAKGYRARFSELDAAWLDSVVAPPLAQGEEPSVRLAPGAKESARVEAPAVTQFPFPECDPGDHRTAQPGDGSRLRRLGEYRILREVGRGGMGVVYEAIQESLGRHVALKVLPFNSLLGPTHLERFRREARAAARLHHTNIVPVFGVGESQGVHFYAMQYIEGQGLDQVLREVRRLRAAGSSPVAAGQGLAAHVAEGLVSGQFRRSGKEHAAGLEPVTRLVSACSPADPIGGANKSHPTPEQSASATETGFSSQADMPYFRSVAQVGVQVAEALEYAHRQGVLHRDIKPSNLLLDVAGTVWVADFGLAKAEGGDELTQPGDLVGTLRYMAPERFEGRSDPRSDVYGLGLTLYELLTLRPAFDDSDRTRLMQRVQQDSPVAPWKIDRRIPRDLDTIIQKGMAREADQRYPTAAALAEDLRRFLADRPILARRISPLEHVWRWCRRNRAVAALAAGLLLALVVLAIGSTVATVLVGFQRDRALSAERGKAEKLWESYVEQAHARRLSRQAGQRFDSLETLGKAIELGRSLELSPKQLLRLRNEVIACLALIDLRSERQLEPRLGSGDFVAFDHQLLHYAVSDPEGNISIRRTEASEEIARLPGPAVRPRWVVLKFSPDGRWLIVGYLFQGRPSEFRRWEMTQGRPTSDVRIEQAVERLDISPDSSRFALERPDGTVGIHDMRTGQLQKRLATGPGLQRIVFHPDGLKLAVLHHGSRTVVVWDLESEKIVSRFEHAIVVNSAAWRPDSQLLAVGCNDQRVYVWDMLNHRLQSVIEGHTGNGVEAAFSHAGDFLISTSWDQTVRLWDPVTGKELVRAVGYFDALANDDRRMILYRDGERHVCEIAGLGECRTLHHGLIGNHTTRPEDWGPKCVDFSGDGRLLASASLDGVRLWDTAAPVAEIAHLPVKYAETALFQPWGTNLLTYGVTGLCLWPIHVEPKAEENHLLLGPCRIVHPFPQNRRARACWAADGRSVLATDWGQSRAILFHLDQREKPVELKPHPGIDSVALSPDGHWAATFNWGSSELRVWDARTGAPAWSLPGTDPAAAFGPDPDLLVTSTSDQKAVRLWRAGSWQLLVTIPMNMNGPYNTAFDPTGTVLAVGDKSHGITLVDPGTGHELATLEPPDDKQCSGVCFSPDGSRLAAATSNHTIHLWDLRLIRQQLADLGLDWDSIPYPPPKKAGLPMRVEVLDPRWFEERAQYWRNNNNYARAIAELHRCVEIDPERANACNHLAWLYVTAPPELRDPDKALPLAEKAVQKEPKNNNYVNTLGVVYYRLGDYQRAVQTLEQIAPKDSGALAASDWFFLAMSYRRLQQFDKAQDCYSRALLYMATANPGPTEAEELNAFRTEAEAQLGQHIKQ